MRINRLNFCLLCPPGPLWFQCFGLNFFPFLFQIYAKFARVPRFTVFVPIAIVIVKVLAVLPKLGPRSTFVPTTFAMVESRGWGWGT